MFREITLAFGFVASLGSAALAQMATPGQGRAIAKEAYIYSYAPIASYATWSKQGYLFFFFRVLDPDPQKAKALIESVRIYPLADRKTPSRRS